MIIDIVDEEIRAISGSLRHLATTRGRRRSEPVDIEALSRSTALSHTGNPFARDKIALLCSKALRRQADKTQVTSMPRNPHIRNRRSHTDEVVACSINIAAILGLNVSLAEAIAIGHDIGHVPFGHPGEKYLAARTSSDFTHEKMGVVIAQHIERAGKGLDLTYEVLEGMYRHSGANAREGMTPEAWVVRYADKIAYIFADYNDFKRMNFPLDEELVELVESFGSDQRQRQRNAVVALCLESTRAGRVVFENSPEAEAFKVIRTLMYKVYPLITVQEPTAVLQPIYDFVERLGMGDPRVIIGLMTDRDIEFLSRQYALSYDHIRQTAVGEILPHIKDKPIDPCDVDLDW